MPLSSGSRLGAYEILAPLGAGGMGEVYRARDPKLDREVAIKVLPQSLAADPAALARFEREARAVAALSHPNILAIHDLGEAEGVRFAVMELLEGESLQQRLGSGALPQRKAIEIAREIALGLAAAHEKGIVHRDLKPGNLFLTRDGRVKILDFGLALRLPVTPATADESPTVTQHTEPGTVMGTVGYISPEQLRGIPADARSDIFSFGAVLYEMLSGRQAFKGDTAIETMNAILKEDPPDLSGPSRPVPPGLDRIVRHCLEKNPSERFQSARDLAFDLAQLSSDSAGSIVAPEGSARRAAGLRPVRAVAAALVLLAAGLAGGAFLAARRKGPEVLRYERLTFRRGNVQSARFSPDGQTILYSAAWEGKPVEIFSVRSDAKESRPINLTAQVMAVSSKGEMAVLVKPTGGNEGTLARVSMSGGTPREVVEEVLWADWAPNGEDLAVVRTTPTGNPQLEYPVGHPLHPARGIMFARVSPDGNLVAFADWSASGWTITVVDRGGKRRALASGFSRLRGLAWSPRGNEVFFSGRRSASDGAIRAVSLSGRERVLLPDGGLHILHDVARDGRLLLERGGSRGGLVCASRADPREREISWLDFSRILDISRDGGLLLFDEQGEAGNPKGDVFLRRTDGTPAFRLGDGRPFALTADARWALARLPGPPAELALLPTGAGSPRKIPVEGVESVGALEIPEGRGFLVWKFGEKEGYEVFVVGPDGGKPKRLQTDGILRESGLAVSPDGRWLAYPAKGGRLLIAPIAEGSAREVPGVRLGGDENVVQWNADGQFLYVARTTVPAVVSRVDVQTGKKEVWKNLAPADRSGVVYVDPVVIAPDGQSYAYSYTRVVASDLYVVEGVR